LSKALSGLVDAATAWGGAPQDDMTLLGFERS
jgi:uncharacterized protein YidB (DUF937 family)